MKITAKKIVVVALLAAMAALLIFTTMRHEPKRAALSHAALSRAARERVEALDDALKNGLISRVEHDKRVAEIVDDDGASQDNSGPPGANRPGDDSMPPSGAPAPAR